MDCLRLVISHSTDDELDKLMSWTKQTDFTDEDFFRKLRCVTAIVC